MRTNATGPHRPTLSRRIHEVTGLRVQQNRSREGIQVSSGYGTARVTASFDSPRVNREVVALFDGLSQWYSVTQEDVHTVLVAEKES